MRLFLPRLVFRLESIAEEHHRFIAEIFLRVGPLGARLNRREFDAVREHMRVEGVNLKRFLENRNEHAGVPRRPLPRQNRDVSGRRPAHPIAPGALLHVAAHEAHRFEDFSDDFAVWVVFYGPVK